MYVCERERARETGWGTKYISPNQTYLLKLKLKNKNKEKVFLPDRVETLKADFCVTVYENNKTSLTRSFCLPFLLTSAGLRSRV